jgi:RND family efflux transporter MFP subunit
MKKLMTMASVAVVIMTAGAVMTGCSSHERIEQPPQGVQARLIQPHSSSGDAGLRFSAVVMPDSQVPLGFRIPGYVVALKQVRGENGGMRDIGEGDAVSQGTVLVRIRPAEYEEKVHQASSQVEAAEAAAQRATLDFERAKRLYDSQSITKPDFDAAKAKYDATQAEVRAARAGTSEAQIALRDTSLVAPFNGDIVKKNVELGAFVGPGSPLLSIAKTDTVKIVIGVPDTTVRSLKLGQPVEVSVDAFPNRTFRARISRMASAADPTTRNFEVEVAIPNRDHMLKVGMIGSLQFANVSDVKQDASVMIPLSSIVQARDGKYGVFVVSQSGTGETAQLRPVEIGTVNGTDITVVSGLAIGDRIVTDGANLLKDGQPVEVLK